MSEQQSFLKSINTNPSCRTTLLAFADWLDDRQAPESDAIRALCRLELHADLTERGGRKFWGFHGGDGTRTMPVRDWQTLDPKDRPGAIWINDRERTVTISAPEHSGLPLPWFRILWSDDGDPAAVDMGYAISDCAGRLVWMVAERFLLLPAMYRREYLTGDRGLACDCRGCGGTGVCGMSHGVHEHCSPCIGFGRVAAKPCPACGTKLVRGILVPEDVRKTCKVCGDERKVPQ